VYAQLIDDTIGKTIVSASTIADEQKKNKTTQSTNVGEQLAKKAKEKGIEKIVFDRGSYKYHGRVKAVAEGARTAGLIF
jgi:large subunit ribosomal protein L18